MSATFVTPKQASAMIGGVSPRTILRYCDRGFISWKPFGLRKRLIPTHEVERIIRDGLPAAKITLPSSQPRKPASVRKARKVRLWAS